DSTTHSVFDSSREVSTQEAKAYAKAIGIPFWEVSVKEDREVFPAILESSLEMYQEWKGAHEKTRMWKKESFCHKVLRKWRVVGCCIQCSIACLVSAILLIHFGRGNNTFICWILLQVL